MGSCTVRRMDEVYRDDNRTDVPALEVMGGPSDTPGPLFWLDPERAFQVLAIRWREETQHFSSIKVKIEHEAYRKIILMGRAVLPCLLEEMAEPDPDHWGPALQAITGAQPVPDEAVGRSVEIAKAWLTWARRNGYLK